jgi:disulfide bond formation protein DsbB
MIAFSIFFLISKKISLKLYYWICTIFFSIGLLFSVWHVGIEQKIFKGLPGCTGKINISQSLTDLKQQILNQNIASCDEVTWSFMNISAATLNSLLLIFLLIINSIFLLQQYYKKR